MLVTYHHFCGNGQSDSSLDRILYSKSQQQTEILLNIQCKLTEPFIASHHDLIISCWYLKKQPLEESTTTLDAPLVSNKRRNVVWTDDGIEQYQNCVATHLSRIQQLWLQNPTRTSVSLLLESTNEILTSFASLTNKTFPLDGSGKSRANFTPKPVRLSQNALKKLNREIRRTTEQYGVNDHLVSMKNEYNKARIEHRKLERRFKAQAAIERDQKLSSGPSHVFSSIRAAKRSKSAKIQKLIVARKLIWENLLKMASLIQFHN